jgi:hypothetical protein
MFDTVIITNNHSDDEEDCENDECDSQDFGHGVTSVV